MEKFNYKLNCDTIVKIIDSVFNGGTIKDIAQEYSLSTSTVHKILHGKIHFNCYFGKFKNSKEVLHNIRQRLLSNQKKGRRVK